MRSFSNNPEEHLRTLKGQLKHQIKLHLINCKELKLNLQRIALP